MTMERKTDSQQQEPPRTIHQKDILQVTLTGPALLATLGALITSIQVLHPVLTCLLLTISSLFYIIRNDYTNFVNLGPGGTPSNFFGYAKISYLRFFALQNPYEPAKHSDFPEQLDPRTGYYEGDQWIPAREGLRPKIAGIAPQRQLDQPGCPKMYHTLRLSLENIAFRHPELYRTGTSCFEKKGLALFARHPINATCRGEICHVHHSDRSMHMNLHPDDAKVILEKGWGERHPLAKGGWMAKYVPREFVMIYAPRDMAELVVVAKIIEAAGFWVCGKTFSMELLKELPDRETSESESG